MRRNSLLSALLALSLFPYVPAFAVDLDFGSTAPTATAAGNGIIMVGGRPQAISAGQQLTPAQAAALNQVLQTGQQSLAIGAMGNAVGGSATLPTGALSSILVPKGVTVIGDFTTNSTLALSGNLVNSGAFYAVSTSELSRIALVSAQNIVNRQGAVISTVLPAAWAQHYSDAITNLNLSLSVRNSLVNAGIISSAADLSIIAENGKATVNNTGGSMLAENGTITFTAAATNPSDTLTVLGGQLVSPVTNVDVACGKVLLSVDQLTGV
jgi:hypothetical protein